MKLSDLVDFNPRRPLEKGIFAPFIEMADLPEGGRDITRIGHREFSGGGSKFSNGDILFARITPCLENGKTVRVSGLPDSSVGHGSTEFIVMAAKDKGHDTDFVYYLTRLPEFRAFAKGRMEGTSGRQRVSWQALADFEFPDIDIKTRKSIAEVLSSLDNRIASNCLVNRTLEDIARTLYKDWFVDFGPVRTKASGLNSRCITAEILSRFPASIDDGGTPRGWIAGKLGDIAESRNKVVMPADVSPETPYIGLEHLPRRCIALSNWDSASIVASNKSRFSKGEILFGKLRPYFHKVGIAPIDGICSTDILVLAPRAKEWDAFVMMCVASDEFVAYTDQTSNGTKMPRTSWDALSRYSIALPDEAVVNAFNEVVRPMLTTIQANVLENKSLATIRDLLLPKLISGELRVNEADSIVGGAV
ncbi:restriction endonuclease subunit S [Limnobacter parvus]|uniref:Restriction endonuclease subunit S n=1 Tax=Limnobacter parvus TaxID=2939690 RepID=A0ABT1XEE7_9BURK|nr:restriction endonuclease subunit S [Limnobacter parvus]MCR2745291.1 restriction endonuclease subunit S [Limnobacter parvus]